MGKAVEVIVLQAHEIHQLAQPRFDLRPAALAMHPHRFGNQIAHPPARIQRGIGILEHHLHLAPKGSKLPQAELRYVLAVEKDLARGDLIEPHEAAPERRFAAARFSDEAKGLARVDLERDTIDGIDGPALPLEQAVADQEMLLHLDRLDQRAAGLGRFAGPVGAHDASLRARLRAARKPARSSLGMKQAASWPPAPASSGRSAQAAKR